MGVGIPSAEHRLLVCVLAATALLTVVVVGGRSDGPATAASTAVRPLPPGRVLESRVGPGLTTIDGVSQGTGRTPASGVAEVKLTGRAGVPLDAEAVFLNVVAVLPNGGGFLTVFPCGIAPPLAANVNYAGGDIVANAVFAKIGTGGKVCIFTSQETDIVIDVNGFTPAGAATTSVSPGRVYESRVGPGFTTFDGISQGTGRTAAGGIAEIDVTDRAGVPGNAEAVFLNVVAVFPNGGGFLTVFPCGIAPPLAANVNYAGGDVAANAVFAKIGAGGKVCIFTSQETDIVVDVNGFTSAGAATTSVSPGRVYESRVGPGFTTIDGISQGTGRTPAGGIAVVKVTNRATLPGSADAVFLNVVAVFPNGGGFLTVYPCGITPPLAANVNYNGGDVAANAVLARVGVGGTVCIFTSQETDIVVDVNGFTPTPPGVPVPPADSDFTYLYEFPGGAYVLDGKEHLGWDPCSPITYAVNPATEVAGDRALMDQAIAVIAAASGFEFQYLGDVLGSMQPGSIDDVTANGPAKAVFGFSDPSRTSSLSGDTVGLGGAAGSVQTLFGKSYLVSGGFVLLDRPDLVTADEQLSTWIHEIAHMIGLDHVLAADEIMRPQLSVPPQTTLGNGDKNGLFNIGAEQCPFGALTRAGPIVTTSYERWVADSFE